MSQQPRQYRQKPSVPPAFRITQAIDEIDIMALRAVEAGTATAYQQKLALRLITAICGTYDQEFVPGHADQSAFRGGRAFVGKAMWKFLKADLEQLLGAEYD